jgi:phenylpropionate dioxygenase-like ring-hydroxylating dioxygenase large terminal subunit
LISEHSRAVVDGLMVDPDEVDRLLAEGATLPAAFYTDPRVARLEDDLIWRRCWQIVGSEAELKRSGDFFTTFLSGTDFKLPVVVVRDEEMRLRAFVNVCRHRAHSVAVGQGNRKSLQCAYHGWTYGLNGCLKTVPRSEEGLPGGVSFDQLGLQPLPVESWAGYVFVAIDPVEPLIDALAEVPQMLADIGFDFPLAPENLDPDHDYVRVTREFHTEANWKVYYENTIECYHCPTTHTHSFSDIYQVDAEHYTFHNCAGGACHLSYYQEGIAERLGINDRDDTPDFRSGFIFPNIDLGNEGQVQTIITRILPDSVNGSYMERVSYRLPGADSVSIDPQLQEELAEKWRVTFEEDLAVTARVQLGLRSGAYQWGYTLPESEKNMRHFYRFVWNALAPAFR